jgi:hypothetical protein
MGFRLYISETPKDYKNILEFRKFYGYCDYKYAKDSFEYLYSICGDEIDDSLFFPSDNVEDTYGVFVCGPNTDRYKLTAEQFRIFISKYIAGMQWWYNDKGNTEKLTLYSFGELPDLYADEYDKYIDWG